MRIGKVVLSYRVLFQGKKFSLTREVKMKKTITVLFLLSFLLSATFSFAQSMTDWERGVFQNIVEKWHALRCAEGDSYWVKKEDLNRIFTQVASEYNISIQQVEEINSKVAVEIPSDYDYRIYDALAAAGKAVEGSGPNCPKISSHDPGSEATHAEIANQFFGISVDELHKIEYIMEECGGIYL